MRNFILGYLLGAASLFGALHYHVVRGNDGFHVVAKTTVNLRDTYADVRAWDATTWTDHPNLAEAVAKANKSDLIVSSASNSISQSIDNLLPRKPKPEKPQP